MLRNHAECTDEGKNDSRKVIWDSSRVFWLVRMESAETGQDIYGGFGWTDLGQVKVVMIYSDEVIWNKVNLDNIRQSMDEFNRSDTSTKEDLMPTQRMEVYHAHRMSI